MRVPLAFVAAAVPLLVACHRDLPTSPTAAVLSTGGKLDERLRLRCTIALAEQASGPEYGAVPPEHIRTTLPRYGVNVETREDAVGLCRDHWGVPLVRVAECADRVAVLLRKTNSSASGDPCLSGAPL